MESKKKIARHFLHFAWSLVLLSLASSMAVMEWSEFHFTLMPSKLGGVGVFATLDIEEGVRVSPPQFEARALKKANVPLLFHKYCIHKNDEEFFCPPRFDCMQIGWFINHSNEPNMVVLRERSRHNFAENNFTANPQVMFFVTCRKIFAGDEVFIDYNSLNEPEHLKEVYYRS